MTRPVRPVALVVLTLCMVYPGVTLLYQGLYPLWAGEPFTLMGHPGPWHDLAVRFGVPIVAVLLAKAALGALWVLGVLGLWAGESKAYPVALLAAAGTLLYPGGATVMAVLALVCLLRFREKPGEVLA
jgi:hypothetical protein